MLRAKFQDHRTSGKPVCLSITGRLPLPHHLSRAQQRASLPGHSGASEATVLGTLLYIWLSFVVLINARSGTEVWIGQGLVDQGLSCLFYCHECDYHNNYIHVFVASIPIFYRRPENVWKAMLILWAHLKQ